MESSFVLTAGPLSVLVVPTCEPWQGFLGYICLDLRLPLFTFQRCGSREPAESPGALWEGIWKHTIESQSWLCSLLGIFHFGYRAETVEQKSQNFERKVRSHAVQVRIPALHLTKFRSAASEVPPLCLSCLI